MIYLLVYTLMNMGAFGIIISLRRRGIIGDNVDDMTGLGAESAGHGGDDGDLHVVAWRSADDRRIHRQVFSFRRPVAARHKPTGRTGTTGWPSGRSLTPSFPFTTTSASSK